MFLWGFSDWRLDIFFEECKGKKLCENAGSKSEYRGETPLSHSRAVEGRPGNESTAVMMHSVSCYLQSRASPLFSSLPFPSLHWLALTIIHQRSALPLHYCSQWPNKKTVEPLTDLLFHLITISVAEWRTAEPLTKECTIGQVCIDMSSVNVASLSPWPLPYSSLAVQHSWVLQAHSMHAWGRD